MNPTSSATARQVGTPLTALRASTWMRGVRPRRKWDVSTVAQPGRRLVGPSDDIHVGSTLRLRASSVSRGPGPSELAAASGAVPDQGQILT